MSRIAYHKEHVSPRYFIRLKCYMRTKENSSRMMIERRGKQIWNGDILALVNESRAGTWLVSEMYPKSESVGVASRCITESLRPKYHRTCYLYRSVLVFHTLSESVRVIARNHCMCLAQKLLSFIGDCVSPTPRAFIRSSAAGCLCRSLKFTSRWIWTLFSGSNIWQFSILLELHYDSVLIFECRMRTDLCVSHKLGQTNDSDICYFHITMK